MQISMPFLCGNGAGSFTKNREIKRWGCANRITNGRAACDSHHVNEDTLQHTYTAAIRDMIEDGEEIMAAVKESAGLVLQPENEEVLNRIEQ